MSFCLFLKIDSLGTTLENWKTVLQREYPDFDAEYLPSKTELDLAKLGDGGVITSDTCNQAALFRRILVDKIMEKAGVGAVCIEQDCTNHLRNVWVKGVLKELTKHLGALLEDKLTDISPILRVSANIESLLISFDKEFNLCANYPKGHGQFFRTWLKENHPDFYLLHVETMKGNRMDGATQGACPVFTNLEPCVEFLDERLRMLAFQNEGNILQENLFTLLKTIQIVGLLRVLSIFHICIVIPHRWLSGKTHELAEYDWSCRSMGWVMDVLKIALEKIIADPKKILNKTFMLGIFNLFKNKLPPFKEYMDDLFEMKQYARVIAEVFTPKNARNKESRGITIELALVAVKAMLKELLDKKKASYKYLSCSGSEYSWEHCPKHIHKACLGKRATNDLSESAHAGVTYNIQQYGKIDIKRAAAISQVKSNSDFSRLVVKQIKRKSRKGKEQQPIKQKLGLFHSFPPELRSSVLIMAMENAPATRKENANELEFVHQARQRKAELQKKKCMEKSTEEYIEATYYFDMYKFPAGWKSIEEMTQGLKELTSKTARLEALKENIRIRVKGFGWKEFEIRWSEQGVAKTVDELAKHLKNIIIAEADMEFPKEPPINIPKRKKTPDLGDLTTFAKNLDTKFLKDAETFKQEAKQIKLTREDAGFGDKYDEMQQRVPPTIDESFVGKRIDSLFEFDSDDSEEMIRWCQGEVIEVCDGTWLKPYARTAKFKENEAVRVRWDAIEECCIPVHETILVVQRHKWRKHVIGGWRLDLSK